MNTPAIIALTAFGTVGVFTAGGVVATQIIKQTMQPAAVMTDAQVSRNVAPVDTGFVAVETLEPTPVAAVQPVAPVAEIAPEPVAAAPAPTTAEILQGIIAQTTDEVADENDVVLYDFVSAEQSSSQFENAIPERMAVSVIDALRDGQSADEIEDMIAAAADLGLIDAPAALSTSDGQADARAILLAIMSEHEASTGEKFTLDTAQEKVAVATPTRNQLYTVEAGDSLAYIALIFYGNTEEYRVIFNANRSKIGSPDSIQIGQRLIIPAI